MIRINNVLFVYEREEVMPNLWIVFYNISVFSTAGSLLKFLVIKEFLLLFQSELIKTFVG